MSLNLLAGGDAGVGEGVESGVLAGGVLAAGGVLDRMSATKCKSGSELSDLHCVVDKQAATIAELQRALAACTEALQAKTAEMHAKIQSANDLVAEVRAASLRGADALETLLPSVGAFYTRPKDSCSECGSTDAVSFTIKRGSVSVVCSKFCGVRTRVGSAVVDNGLKRRREAELTPLLMLSKQANDAKQATVVFLYIRCSTLFVPPASLPAKQAVLDNFAEQYFAHLYAVDNSLVFPGAGDVFLVPRFYVKLGPSNTRIVDWEQEWATGAAIADFVSPRQMVSDVHSVLSSKPAAKAVILTNDPVDFGDCVHHFRDFLVSFTDDERQRLFLVTRRSGSVFATCSTYSAQSLLAAIDGRHQFVNVPFEPTFFLRRMWEGMNGSLRPAFFDPDRQANRIRSMGEIDYSTFLRPSPDGRRAFVRM
jgi:hypothetical protein